jgi:hypothetical protein
MLSVSGLMPLPTGPSLQGLGRFVCIGPLRLRFAASWPLATPRCSRLSSVNAVNAKLKASDPQSGGRNLRPELESTLAHTGQGIADPFYCPRPEPFQIPHSGIWNINCVPLSLDSADVYVLLKLVAKHGAQGHKRGRCSHRPERTVHQTG